MKKIEQFTNLYPISKTLRFKLIPVGETQKNFEMHKLLEADKLRAENYAKAKKIIDSYHREFIDSVLSRFSDSEGMDEFMTVLRAYSHLYYKANKDKTEKAEMENFENKLRQYISKALTGNEKYKILFKNKEFIENELPLYLKEREREEDAEVIASFSKFTTYFSGFFTNRKNVYSDEAKSTAICYRCVDENLPKFLDNAKTCEKYNIFAVLSQEIAKINESFVGIYGTTCQDVFSIDYYPFVLAQSGIERYNNLIGGYTLSDGTKTQGINEIINLYNQQLPKEEKNNKIPFLKPLYKQILSDTQSISFIPEKFESDDDVLQSIKQFFEAREEAKSINEVLADTERVFSNIKAYNPNGIFVKNGLDLTTVCKKTFGHWEIVQEEWNSEYDAIKGYKDNEKYIENRKKAFKQIKSFSVNQIQAYASTLEGEIESQSIYSWISEEIKRCIQSVILSYNELTPLLAEKYHCENKLYNNEEAVVLIKTALDSVKELEKTMKLFLGTGKEELKDENFYGEVVPLYDRVCEVDKLYDKVRNYMTQKPYKTNKIKLNFNCSSFFSGWAQDYSTKGTIIIRRDNKYYLAIIDKKLSEEEKSILFNTGGDSSTSRVVYDFQKPDNKNTPRLFIRSKGEAFAPAVEKYNLPIQDIIDSYDNGYYKSEYQKKDPIKHKESLIKLIDYFKLGFTRHESYSHFNFVWKDSSEYHDIAEFYHDVIVSCYDLKKENISYAELMNLVAQGKIYLFEIYNKDFSPYSKGTPNLHTLYFKELFEKDNLEQKVIMLNGGGEVFYREASINESDIIKHPKKQPIQNKNKSNPKQSSTFDYDLIKDKRFTVNQFVLHVPVTLNYSAKGIKNINSIVRNALRNCENNYVIGIDRGERNLLYICVIDSYGNIVEQYSLNEIINSYHDVLHKVNYHNLLEQREKEREQARESWKSIENIKELKEGYISQVVHIICRLVEKYDAVIAMEDLNSGFKNSRKRVEKSVYQKFEKMLIDKLNYCADKKKDFEKMGSILNAYQLTNKFESFKQMGLQNGFIFYIPAWLTSKIDPMTGFVNLLDTRYKSVSSARDFVKRIDRIAFNETENYFEFDIDYDRFPKTNATFCKKWTLCSYGKRIRTYRNPAKNGEWDSEEILLTDSFKELFSGAGLDIDHSLKEQILAQDSREFFEKFMGLLKLLLQMRNSQTGTDIDYLISPVKNSQGIFYNSDDYKDKEDATLPKDADANGAYNIARKALWAIKQFKLCEEEQLDKVKISINKEQWLKYAQENN